VVEIRLCGGVEVLRDGQPLPESLLAGRQGRLVLSYLVCERGRPVPREKLAELLWADRLPTSWTSSLSAVISRLRRLLTDAGLDGTATLSSPSGAYRLDLPADAAIDWETAHAAVASAEEAVAAGDGQRALAAAAEATAIGGRGFIMDDCEWVDAQRNVARDLTVRAALARSDAFALMGSPAAAVEAAREALRLDERREAAFRALMRAHAGAGERAEALRVWERCRTTLVDELGVDPSPETEAVYLAILGVPPAAGTLPSGVVTFLLTDIVDSSAMWDRHPAAMAAALERHDAIVAEVVAAAGGALLKSKLEGDATVSVFERATAGALAARDLRDALKAEQWPDAAEPHVRMALHTGEAYERAGDYFGPALNRAARLRSLARADQILLSQAAAELVRDHLPADAVLADRGHRDLRGLARGENVYELAPRGLPDDDEAATATQLPPALTTPADAFVGRVDELAALGREWQAACTGATRAMLVGGEPGVGKSRLAAEFARTAFGEGALVLYGRCEEELDAPYQPFLDAVRATAPVIGPRRMREVRGVEELIRVAPELADFVPGAASATRADPDTERHALFNAVTQLLAAASAEAPVVFVIDDLHWAGKTTLALLRHVLRNGHNARLLIVGTYRDTELSRTHPLAATIADLRGDGLAGRLRLEGLPVDAVVQYTAASGFDDRALGAELAKITAGNPFFLIETLRHIRETGGEWRPGSLPEGVKEASGRRLSRLSESTTAALAVAAVVGSSFDLDLVETVQGADLVDEMDDACRAGVVVEEPGRAGAFRFAHALVRQVLLSELVTVRRIRLHRTIAEILEARAGDTDAYLTDLAHHWFECASAGSADKAVSACRRAGEVARAGLAYEEASDLFTRALVALEETDDPGGETAAALHLARCDVLLAAGELDAARNALDALAKTAARSPRLLAWHVAYASELAIFTEPHRLGAVVDEVAEAAATMRAVGDVVGEAKALYVHALALERLGRIGEAEAALDHALSAARRAQDRRLADAVLAQVPQVVLWGPSPVPRASGRCLDVVRVCRITDGGAAVESVAVRTQAVLEALRGRFDAARRMIASARRTVVHLGLAHHRLETDIAAGLVELFAHEWAAAEQIVRPAWDELRVRRLGGEASRAGGLLARALLMQRRLDEAESVIAEARDLAGEDLRAGVGWRIVTAELAARRGDHRFAVATAREAVHLAAATDALVPLANARLSLAAVLESAGQSEEAEAEMARAIAVCEAKGASALAEAARSVDRRRAVALPDLSQGGLVNSAVRLMDRAVRVAASGDLEATRQLFQPDFVVEDRRKFVEIEQSGQPLVEVVVGAMSQIVFEVLATRGDRLMLGRAEMANERVEFEMLAIVACDATPTVERTVWFDLDDLETAYNELDGLYAQELARDGNTAIRTWGGVVTAWNAGDWKGVAKHLAPDMQAIDRRRFTQVEGYDHEADLQALFDLSKSKIRMRDVVGTRGDHAAVVGITFVFRDQDAGESEGDAIGVFEVNDEGKWSRVVIFDADSVDAALEELATR
jgi:DNA-binding SARP family transcriptional activator